MLIFNLPSLGNVLFYSEDFLIDGTIVTHTGSLESGWLLYMPRYLTLNRALASDFANRKAHLLLEEEFFSYNHLQSVASQRYFQ